MDLLIIFGALVRPDGKPSGAIVRRTEGAIALAQPPAGSKFLITGTPPEVAAMRAILAAAGVARADVFEDDASPDTLTSVIRCAEMIRRLEWKGDVIVCSDRYHVPRCRWLFRMLKIPTTAGNIPSGRKANGAAKWMYFYARETAAIVADTIALAFRLPETAK